jgi:predicted PurR-regulated permease PerM
MSDLLASVRRHRQELFALAVFSLLALLLWNARGALPVFFIGLALVFVLDPAVTRLARAGLPRWAGVLVMYAVVVGVIWALIAYALPPITAQAREFVDQLPRLGAALAEWEQGLEEWYLNLPLPSEIRDMIDEQLSASGQAIAELLQALLAPTLTALLRAANFILGLVVIPVWLFYVLKDRERFAGAVAGAMPPGWRADIGNMLGLLGRVGGRWVRGQLLLGVAIFIATVIGVGLLVVIGFSEFGQFVLVLALIAGVLEWFPIIGPIVAAIPAVLIGLSISLPAAIAAVIVYTVIQQLENHLLVPKVMGDAVDLHPAVLVMSLVIGGALFGIGGAILAAPVVSAARDLYRYGFHRFGGRTPAEAFDLAIHGARPPIDDPDPPSDVAATPSPA